MIDAERDGIPKLERPTDFVPNAEGVRLDRGHRLQQEMPEESNQAILEWLDQQGER